jgi:hypothetical protein
MRRMLDRASGKQISDGSSPEPVMRTVDFEVK